MNKIDPGKIDTGILEGLEPDKVEHNIKLLNDTLANIVDLSIHIWETQNHKPIRLSQKCQKLIKTIQLYKKYKSILIDIAKDYEERKRLDCIKASEEIYSKAGHGEC